MSLRGINTLVGIIKTGAALMIVAMSILTPAVGSPNQTVLAAIDIVQKQNVKETHHKKTDYKQPKRTSTAHKKSYHQQSKRKTEQDSSRIKISGYRGKTFVYGEVIPQKNGKLQGFIYHPGDSKTYVYGEAGKDTLNLYDNSGNLYQMLR